MRVSASDKIIDSFIILLVTVASFICLVPILHLIAVSLSSNAAILSNKVTVFPVEWNTLAYETVFKDAKMISSLFFTIILVVVFTVVCMIMTICAAYPLTKKKLKGRDFFLIIIVFTMFFSGGLIPEYLLVKSLKLTNTIWSLVLPGMINAFYLIILKSFFSSIPEELEESARIDGSSHFGTLFRIVLPLSLPVLATLSLFYAVGRWNGFMDALFYITNQDLYPIQLKLYQLVISNQMSDATATEGMNALAPIPESLKAASIMFATIPILLVYPWLQRYFISGIMIGAVKG
ncbi:carbohydrate ABC transporter permease [Paenibacillus sp. CGMCC 1.16610]|uniref:Carbohydrate ABC transporter permease n=2 Tax=Paenibacillus TaxID=44249 RepID=A0ABU6DCS5_9BACL|nr:MULTISPECIES: carbohydrate ABC transporter permease [Paenibacillus]MBA2939131.1 carbohydrate ABC transporter permease [Paenibacillus sp. CGMCC 1.16610]MCY9662948.1 carbohydrate ABC transporter permease [Paenibacillus anseongense]MEB4795569.1 carbohydrate ABC transporter permease [Paenibacillus chondroitinus]MVQ35090.1 ABC transporter permease subunit [Paenibacillus anseongense]